MEICSLSEFMKAIEPWLSRDYIRNVFVDRDGDLKLFFLDGVSNTYHIDNCTRSQLRHIIDHLKENGVPVENLHQNVLK